jgi:peptidoglycan lytic transglycosylase B
MNVRTARLNERSLPTPFSSFVHALAGAALVLTVSCAAAQTATFDEFLADVRAEALQKGIQPATLDVALAGLAPIPRVIELDRRQPESTITFEEYMARVVTPEMVAKGRASCQANRELLAKVEAAYGVPAAFVCALWGIESRYGENMGSYSVIGSLATLAYDARRAAFFRKELFEALAILDEGHIRSDLMMGSWAGAMGQSQFMPSSFRAYAVDFDKDGRRDIWTTQADVFASAANYLKKAGWKQGEPWGQSVFLPQGFDVSRIGNKQIRSVKEWKGLGVEPLPGFQLPADDVEAAVVRPGGEDGQAYLVRRNYQVILKWNRSDFFGLAVVTLADRIAQGAL